MRNLFIVICYDILLFELKLKRENYKKEQQQQKLINHCNGNNEVKIV